MTTIEQIECRAEAKMDALDRSLMKRLLTQAEYDAEVKKLDRWVELGSRFAQDA
jgi:hypothetical protein